MGCRQHPPYRDMRDQDRAWEGKREGWAREPALPSHHALAQNPRVGETIGNVAFRVVPKAFF